ncbi:hypothetical protein D3C81_260650 [compost metagenome]
MAFVSSVLCSVDLSLPIRSGSRKLAASSVVRMTPAARKIIRSLAGKGDSLSSARGRDKVLASVIVPRTPPKLRMSPSLHLLRREVPDSLSSGITANSTHKKRRPNKNAVIRRTYRIRLAWLTSPLFQILRAISGS